MNTNLAKATVVGALGGLLFGFDTAVISGTTHALTIVYGSRPQLWALPFRSLCGARFSERCRLV